MTSLQSRRVAAERGYSLIEVLIAMAILGTVLVSIMGLFTLAKRNIYGGKQMTQAISAGTRVMEDLSTLNKTATLAAFGLGTATTGTSNTVGGQTFPNSFVRTTTDISTTTDPNGFLARWRDEIVNYNKFKDGVVTIVFTPTADSAGNNPVRMTTGTIVRMRVFVTWREATRSRQIVMDTVKIERN